MAPAALDNGNTNGRAQTTGRKIKLLLVDLDDTLYVNEEMPQLVKENIQRYTEEHLGVHAADVQEVTLANYLRYGTTYAGLVAGGCKIDADRWHARVHHTLPYRELLRPDPKLRALLQSVPVPMWIFTNADRKHAELCLDALGLNDLFKGVICFETLMAEGEKRGLLTPEFPVLCKPHANAFALALELAGGRPESTAFVDDSTRNVAAARAAGIYAVLAGRTGANCGADLELPSLLALCTALPELWEDRPVQDHGEPVDPQGVEELGPQRIRQASPRPSLDLGERRVAA